MGLSFGQAVSRAGKWVTKKLGLPRARGTIRASRPINLPKEAQRLSTQRLNVTKQVSPPPFATSFNVVGDMEHGFASAIRDAAQSVAAAARDQGRELGKEAGALAKGIGAGLGDGNDNTLLIIGAVVLVAVFVVA